MSEYSVETILNKRRQKGTEYKVKWVGSNQKDSWQPLKNLFWSLSIVEYEGHALVYGTELLKVTEWRIDIDKRELLIFW